MPTNPQQDTSLAKRSSLDPARDDPARNRACLWWMSTWPGPVRVSSVMVSCGRLDGGRAVADEAAQEDRNRTGRSRPVAAQPRELMCS